MTDPSNTKEHHVAMAARAMMSGLDELIQIAHDGNGYELVKRDVGDLVLTYILLGRLIETVKRPMMEAAE